MNIRDTLNNNAATKPIMNVYHSIHRWSDKTGTNLYRKVVDYHKKFPTTSPVGMTEKEQNFFIDNISGARNYLEYGTGGSTFLALQHSNANITAVESDPAWINYMGGVGSYT